MKITFVSAKQALTDVSIRTEWQRRTQASTNLNVMYSSPGWVEHLVTCDDHGSIFVAVAVDDEQRIRGIAPVQIDTFTLKYDIASRAVASSRLRAAMVLGSEPLAEEDNQTHGRLLEAILERFGECDCVYLDSARVGASCWEWLQTREAFRRARPYIPDAIRPWHRLDLGSTFEEYLAGMSTKSRQTLRKHVKSLREFGGGQLLLEPVITRGEVPRFVSEATAVSRESWQHRILGARLREAAAEEQRLTDLADRGILRAYLLRCGGQSCAFLIGYQSNGVFHYAETGFAEAFAHLSPGTVLLYLVIEDLHRSDSPSTVNFGVGDGVHKRRFGNAQSTDATVLLFRPTARNVLRMRSHQLFNATVRLAKRITRRRVSK